MMRKKKICFLFLLMLLIIPQMGCGGEAPVSRSSFYFDTPCTITIYDMDEEEAGSMIADAFRLCQDLESKLSRTVEGSDIDRINAAKGQPVAVSRETIQVLKKGLYYSELSQGVFDITAGRVTELWDFKENPQIPDSEVLKEALATVDYRNLKIEGITVTLAESEGKIDLGGIGKGYAADKLANFLLEGGAEKAIINLGGNVAVIGEKEEHTPWEVGLERPFSNQSEIMGTMKMTDQTVVTSGIYERFFEKDDVRYHHILDLETGMPVNSDLNSVTILGPVGASADCDALSTICFLLGEERGKALLESKEGLEGLFLRSDGTFSQTSGMNFTPISQD